MLGILKSKTHMMSKLFVYQIAMSLLGVFVSTPFKGKIQIAAGIFSTLFFFSLVCYAVIEDGQKDFISVSSGRSKGSAYSGFVYALVAYAPTIILVLIQMCIRIPSWQEAISGLPMLLGMIVRFFFMGMYLGIENGLMDRWYDPAFGGQSVSHASESVQFFCNSYIIYAVLLLLFPIVCGITYMLAYKGKIHVNTETKKK